MKDELVCLTFSLKNQSELLEKKFSQSLLTYEKDLYMN